MSTRPKPAVEANFVLHTSASIHVRCGGAFFCVWVEREDMPAFAAQLRKAADDLESDPPRDAAPLRAASQSPSAAAGDTRGGP